jgi:hypothetical protein
MMNLSYLFWLKVIIFYLHPESTHFYHYLCMNLSTNQHTGSLSGLLKNISK